ncbi:MAG: D-alanyl-D-alanine carboxypeptidase/D-alanyl-D-alanine-endopeptidase [Melioribacteraceae bacterium]|nr:D-alanyl-D-alanine carboxypeptidase/D-alanyl-D-alanine-endopeptidase [Melioribacteraceae bacterium]
MRIIHLIIYFVISNLIFSQNYLSIQNYVDKEKSTKLLKHASWSIAARYLDNGEKIISHNAELALAPASNMKLITSSAALEILGENYKFATRIFYDGTVDAKGKLNGNLFIVGGGDPTLGYNLVKGALPLDDLMASWLTAFNDKEIKSISGDIIADDLLYDRIPIPNNWDWIDIGNYYAASASALTIHNNLYFLFFKPGKNVGDIAEVLRTEPIVDGLTFINYIETGKKGSGDNGYIFNAPLQFNATLRGTIPKGKKEFSIKGSIPNPPLFAAQYFLTKLREEGISVAGKAIAIDKKRKYNKNNLVVKTYSPPLKEIVFIVNKRSDNLYTEMLLRAVGLKAKGEGSVDSGIDAVEEFLSKNGINTSGLLMHDGCGLSRSNAITTTLMLDLLTLVAKKKYFETFYNSLAVVGDPNDIGFFKNMGRGTAIEKNAHIKSGVIGGVRAYSGYLKDKNGRTIIFSMIANNFNGNGSAVSNVHKKIMIKLAELK